MVSLFIITNTGKDKGCESHGMWQNIFDTLIEVQNQDIWDKIEEFESVRFTLSRRILIAAYWIPISINIGSKMHQIKTTFGISKKEMHYNYKI